MSWYPSLQTFGYANVSSLRATNAHAFVTFHGASQQALRLTHLGVRNAGCVSGDAPGAGP